MMNKNIYTPEEDWKNYVFVEYRKLNSPKDRIRFIHSEDLVKFFEEYFRIQPTPLNSYQKQLTVMAMIPIINKELRGHYMADNKTELIYSVLCRFNNSTIEIVYYFKVKEDVGNNDRYTNFI